MLQLQSFAFNPLQENTYVLFDETKECVIIDPGCYEREEQYDLADFIETNQLKVVKLLNTHGHVDHVLGNAFVKETYKTKLYIHEQDAATLKAVKVYAPHYGKPFKFSVEINADFKPDTVDAFQLIERTWKQAGLDVTVNYHSDELFGNARAKPEADAAVWVGENGCGQLPLLNLGRFMNDYGYWSLGNWSGWAAWDAKRLNPDATLAEGVVVVEPPVNVQRLYELRSIIPTTVGEEQAALMGEFTDLLAEEFLTIGIANPAGYYRSVKNNLHNVPAGLIEGWLYPGPAPANFSTFFFK